jgi:hypothetical protein
MIDVRLDFQERVSQIDRYLTLVWISDSSIAIENLDTINGNKVNLNDGSEIELSTLLEGGNKLQFDQELSKILKSNAILLYYNLIEGTISLVLNEFFDKINQERSKYDLMTLSIKKIWLKYKHRSFGVGTFKDDDYILSTIESIINEIIEIQPKSIRDYELGNRTVYNYEAYCKETNSNDISGNLDAREIRNIFSLYGLPEISQRCDSMLKVKNKRNSLAHGNETFAQVGSNFTIDDLFRMKIEIIDFLDTILNEVETFLRDKKYLKANA